jgi:hypothetical protein
MEIDMLEGVQLGGITQWIRIRGADASNPVLLLMQQGPGLPMINEARRLEHLLGLEKAFTVVYWDQRGTGLSSPSLRKNSNRFEISVARMVDDTVALLELLRDRFGGKTFSQQTARGGSRRGGLSLGLSSRPELFTDVHPDCVCAVRGRWRPPVNAGEHCWKACWGNPREFESRILRHAYLQEHRVKVT